MSHQHSRLACGLCPDSACISSLPRITSRPSGDLSVHLHADMGIHSLAVPPCQLAAWRINAHLPGPSEGRTPFAGRTELQGPTGLPAWSCPSPTAFCSFSLPAMLLLGALHLPDDLLPQGLISGCAPGGWTMANSGSPHLTGAWDFLQLSEDLSGMT